MVSTRSRLFSEQRQCTKSGRARRALRASAGTPEEKAGAGKGEFADGAPPNARCSCNESRGDESESAPTTELRRGCGGASSGTAATLRIASESVSDARRIIETRRAELRIVGAGVPCAWPIETRCC
jgi:hypothetical protein